MDRAVVGSIGGIDEGRGGTLLDAAPATGVAAGTEGVAGTVMFF